LAKSGPAFDAFGVGHSAPPQPASDMGGVHGASRDIDAPAGVTFSRQISAHSVEPTIASRSRNLLSHDDRGPAGTDEAKEVGPQMPCVVNTTAFARDRERLAGARASPERPIIGPAGETGGVGPPADARKEVALVETKKVIRLNFRDTAFINFTFCQVSRRD
jgi:hypothetical protein